MKTSAQLQDKFKRAKMTAKAYYKEIVNSTRKNGSYPLIKVYNTVKGLTDNDDLLTASHLEALLRDTQELQLDLNTKSFIPIRRYNPIRKK